MSISLALEHKLSLINSAASDCTSSNRRDGLGGGPLFEGGDYFKYFRLRDAINRGTAIIQGNMVV